MMLKMFTTQLIGRVKKIEELEQDSIEDGARLLAQALVGDGNIFIYTEREMTGVYDEMVYAHPLPRVNALTEDQIESLHEADRVILFSRRADDENLLQLARVLRKKHIPFIAVSSTENPDHELDDLAHVFIRLHSEKGLIPKGDGERTGFSHTICALYVYHNIKLLIDDLLEEYD